VHQLEVDALHNWFVFFVQFSKVYLVASSKRLNYYIIFIEILSRTFLKKVFLFFRFDDRPLVLCLEGLNQAT
ncbi:hypothetical protein, partial [Aerococcus sp. UMB7834]|uniref:hypothetical protein n=1 Tax=Aerococcus sp. UMB7834 TaxID=3046342 RepID=UPI00254E7762